MLVAACTCYCMHMLERRVQILLDADRYARLSREARRRKRSVGALVREAIDVAYPASASRRAAAGRAILGAARMEVPDLPGLKAELDELRGRRA